MHPTKHLANSKSDDNPHFFKDVAQTLNLIYGERSVSGIRTILEDPESLRGSRKNIKSWESKKRDDHIVSSQYVTSVSSSASLKVKKRFVKPKVPKALNSRSIAENVVRKLIGHQDLNNILLFITPMSTSDHLNCYKLHSYCLDNQRHLGATTVTSEELELIERYHSTDNYSIVYCTYHIDLADAARNTSIKTKIFETVREQSQFPNQTLYQGNTVSLFYRCVIPKQKLAGMQSLKQSMIPVHMHRQFPSVDKSLKTKHRFDLKMIRPKSRSDQKKQTKRSKSAFSRYSRRAVPDILKANITVLKKTSVLSSFVKAPLLCKSLPFKHPRKNKVRCGLLERSEEVTLPKTALTNSIVMVDVQKSAQSSEVVRNDSQNEGINRNQNEVQMLLEPNELRYSVGQIPLPPMIPSIISIESLIHKTSTFFACLTGPASVPSIYSLDACLQLEQKLRNLSVKQAFSKFGRLVERINEHTCPHHEHLITFFQFAEILDFKMFVRREYTFLDCISNTEPRYRIECYVFDDRRDYITSIALLCRQFYKYAKLGPRATCNFRFIDTAFEMTHMPTMLTGWLKSALNAIHARPLYNLLGELSYECIQPPSTLLELTTDLKSTKK